MSTTEVAALIGAIGGPLAVAIPALFAWGQYRANSRVQRAQWLASLFEKFYEKDVYREVRGLIESANEDDFLSRVDDDPDIEQKWTDYLNFFEFLAYLQEIGELKRDDINAMFRYWIDSLGRPKFEGYMMKYGYENLVNLLERRDSGQAAK